MLMPMLGGLLGWLVGWLVVCLSLCHATLHLAVTIPLNNLAEWPVLFLLVRSVFFINTGWLGVSIM